MSSVTFAPFPGRHGGVPGFFGKVHKQEPPMDALISSSAYPFRPLSRSIRPFLLLLLTLVAYLLYRQLTATASSLPVDLSGRPSFTFVPNLGQSDPAVRFQTHSLGTNFYFTENSVRLGGTAQLHFLGTGNGQAIEGQEVQPGVVNYLAGQNPNEWHSNLPTYGSLTYPAFYSGVDLRWQGSDGQLVGTFKAEPGANLQQIRWRYEGITPQLDKTTGELWLVNEAGETAVVQAAPDAWQTINGKQVSVPVHYILVKKGAVELALGSYQRAYPLIIETTVPYFTLYPPNDMGTDITVDDEGYAYVTGGTASGDFPTTDALQPAIGGLQTSDAFIIKLSPDGQTLIYSTYLGGSGDEQADGIVVDSPGNVFITGLTNSLDFPMQNAWQPEIGGDWDAFVSKLSADGTELVYSTYLGGSFIEHGNDIAIDSSGGIYVTGSTWSNDFPTVNAIQTTHGGDIDEFIFKFTPDGSEVSYSTYLGGSGREQGLGITVSQSGDAYVTGDTTSINFPVVNALQSSLQGIVDAFVARLSAEGNTLIYSTYLGGASIEVGQGIVLGSGDHAFITGSTASPDFPIVNGVQPVMSSPESEAFIVELNSQGDSIIYSSYLGGSGFDLGDAITLDANENIYLTGRTNSLDFPSVNALQPTMSLGEGYVDAFAAKLTADGSTLAYSTYLGGIIDDSGRGIAVDNESHAYITGSTYSPDFPVANALQANNAGELDAFVSKLSTDGTALDYSTYLGGSSAYPAPTNVTLISKEPSTLIDQWLLYLFGAITLAIGVIWFAQLYHHRTKTYSEDHG
jgi:hypothetical protein